MCEFNSLWPEEFPSLGNDFWSEISLAQQWFPTITCHHYASVTLTSLSSIGFPGCLFPITGKLPGLENLQVSACYADPRAFLLSKVINYMSLSSHNDSALALPSCRPRFKFYLCFNGCVSCSKLFKLLEPRFLSLKVRELWKGISTNCVIFSLRIFTCF